MAGEKHTPGPWVAEGRDWRGEPSPHHVYISGDPRVSCDDDDEAEPEECRVTTAVAIVEGNATSRDVTEANARLISAAPELLAALEEMLRLFDGRAPMACRAAKLAIAKATGQTYISDKS